MAYKFAPHESNSWLDSNLYSTTAPAFHGTNYLSIVARFQAENVTENGTICWLEFDDTDGNRYLLRACGGLSGDPVRFSAFSEGEEQHISSSSAFSANTWHTVIATANRSAGINVSLDGGAFAYKFTSKFPNGNASWVRIGGVVGYRTLRGSVAEVALYDCNLAASAYSADVAALAKGFSPASIRPQNLLAYWPLVRGLQDHVGGHTLTAQSDPVVVEHPRVIA